MSVSLASDPPHLYRIGRQPDPLAWPPSRGYGRYGDPLHRRSTIYAAIQRRAAFLEVLDSFRPSIATLAEAAALPFDDPTNAIPPAGRISPATFARVIVKLKVAGARKWLDLRSLETHSALGQLLYSELHQLGYGERFVFGDLLSRHHDVNRLITRWAIDNDFDGIAYPSCHDPALTCWAIFEGSSFELLESPAPIATTDPDLVAVAKLWNLEIPGHV